MRQQLSSGSEASRLHPADELIRELALGVRQGARDDVETILDRMATADFLNEEALFEHVTKRVDHDREWAPATTAESYLESLHRACRHADARVAVFIRRGGAIAMVAMETAMVLNAQERGMDWKPILVVFYSADRGRIISGYQLTTVRKVGIPKEIRWLN